MFEGREDDFKQIFSEIKRRFNELQSNNSSGGLLFTLNFNI